MTKVTILGDESKQEKIKKIEFVYSIGHNGRLFKPIIKPYEFKKITVDLKTGDDKYDLFICEDGSNVHYRYLGHFNDGIVE